MAFARHFAEASVAVEVSAVEAAVTVGAAAGADSRCSAAADSVVAAKVEAAVSESPELHPEFPACSHYSAGM